MKDYTQANKAGQALTADEAFGLQTLYAVQASLFPAFAVDRMTAFHVRQKGETYYSKFATLNLHRYTNPYRILDRVSQVLVKTIAMDPALNDYQRAFCCYVFRVANEPSTYSALLAQLGEAFNPAKVLADQEQMTSLIVQIKRIIGEMRDRGENVYRPAYKRCTAVPFVAYFDNLVAFSNAGFTQQFKQATCLEDYYNMLTALVGFGPFLSYQLALDWNYCRVNPFKVDFVVPGPGARRGLAMVFGQERPEIQVGRIKWLAYNYRKTFDGWRDFEHQGHTLPLLENDVQNLFCEFSKFFGAQVLKDTPKRKLTTPPTPLEITIPGQYYYL